MSTILQRKSIVQTCKTIIKYMDVEDGREEIDTLLDEAACCLANVSQRMHDYWVRALVEREAEEARQAQREVAMKRAKPRRVTRGSESAKNQLADMLKANPEMRKALIRRLKREQLLQEGNNGKVVKEDEEQPQSCCGEAQDSNDRQRAHL